jgi:dethiobiotin synthetase
VSGVPDLPSSVPGCLVTGTDTGVGKTVLAAAIVAALAARGWRVVAQKPVLSGLEDAAPGLPEEAVRGAPGDHELLGRCAGMEPEEVAPLRFGPPVSPHLAAELAGQTIDVPGIVARIGAIRADALIVEGVGGLLVPLASGWDVRRLAAALGLPVVIAARPGLGTINHTLLTLEAARRGGLNVRAVVLTPWPESPSVVQRSNRETIEKLGRVAVLTLERVDPLSPGPLARAGARLPLDALIARLGRPNSDRPAP